MYRLRRWTALSLVFALLSVSSIPMVAVAAVCDMPGMDKPVVMMMDDDTKQCYIECGCRAHQELDALPHQLAPHALDCAVIPHELSMMRQMLLPQPPLSGVALKIFLPPPEHLIS